MQVDYMRTSSYLVNLKNKYMIDFPISQIQVLYQTFLKKREEFCSCYLKKNDLGQNVIRSYENFQLFG